MALPGATSAVRGSRLVSLTNVGSAMVVIFGHAVLYAHYT
jgi:hypothetical protein